MMARLTDLLHLKRHLVVFNFCERLSKSKQAAQKFDVKRLDLK